MTGTVDLGNVLSAIDKVAGAATDALKGFSEGLAGVGQALQQATARFVQQSRAMGETVLSLARAGLVGTAEGHRLSFVWLQLARQLASVFLPAINAVIDGLQRLTGWFKGLSGDQQHTVAMLTGVGVALAAFGPIFGRLITAISPISMAVAALLEGLMQFFKGTDEGRMILTGLGDIFKVVSEAIGGFGNLFKSVAEVFVIAFQGIVRGITWVAIKIAGIIEEILGWIPGLGDAAEAVGKWRENAQANLDRMMASGWGIPKGQEAPAAKSQVNPSGFGFESLSASFERITSNANKQDLAREQLEIQKKQLVAQLAIVDGVRGGQEQAKRHGGGDF